MMAYVKRMVTGWARWLTLAAIYFSVRHLPNHAPRPVRVVVHLAVAVESIATWPVGAIGTIYWGTGPQPAWVRSVSINAAGSLLIYGVLGLAIGAMYSRWRRAPRTRRQ